MVMRFSTVATLLLASGLSLMPVKSEAARPSYATRIMADGPIGYWRLGEAPGAATAADSSGNANHGTYSGGITLGQPGFHGGDTAALFDGATGRIVVPNSLSLNPRHLTMEAKVQWAGPNRTQQRILEKSSYEQLAQYGLSILDDGHVRVEIRTTTSGTLSVDVNSAALVPRDVETHIVATFDGQFVRIYFNGILDSETSVGANAGDVSPGPPPTLGRDLGIGNQFQVTRDRPFNGLIDEVALFGRALTAGEVLAHFQAQLQEAEGFQYAVKFVCGKADGSVVAPGSYFTAINVHNPNERRVAFKKKFAIALPGERPGRVSSFFDAKLGPDEAFEIDCPDILRHADPRAGFLKGFAVIETPLELDIVAVYTAAGSTGQVETMELERVAPRRRRDDGKPDLVPFPDPRLGFCRRDGSKLTVTVKNQGSVAAGPSTTSVDFGALGTLSQPTPGLAAGASTDLVFVIPSGCFNPDCEFKVSVDSGGQVDEAIEANNTGDGLCRG